MMPNYSLLLSAALLLTVATSLTHLRKASPRPKKSSK